ncbi:TIGR01620 family protein [Sulfurimonas sp.]
MSIKPFSQIVEEKNAERKEELKPFIASAKGGVKLEEQLIQADIKEKQNFIQKSISFLGSISGFFSALLFFLFIAIFVDTLQNIESLYQSKSLLDSIYLLGLFLLFTTLTIVTYKNYRQIKKLKNATKIQKFYTQQRINPTKEIIPTTIKLLQHYTKTLNAEGLLTKIDLLQTTMSNSHNYKEIYQDLDRNVLAVLDKKAKEKITKASIQAAISTAISPLALLDALIVIWRSFLLTKEIAQIYGYKPNIYTTLILLKRGAFNVFFAGAAELASEYANETLHNSLLSKVSLSASQGIVNGVLLARLGYGIMRASRPLPLGEKRKSFMNSTYQALKNSFKAC